MIQVTKEEATAIRNTLRDVHVVSTNKRSSRARNYYVEDSTVVQRFLSRFRENKKVSPIGVYEQ